MEKISTGKSTDHKLEQEKPAVVTCIQQSNEIAAASSDSKSDSRKSMDKSCESMESIIIFSYF